MTFEPGSVVTLKSGGHQMTVVAIDEEDIDCIWIDDEGHLLRHTIPAVALAVTDESEEDDEEEEDEEEEQEEEEEEEEEEEQKSKKRA